MKVQKLLLLKGRPNSGKSTVLKTVINLVSTWQNSARLLLCRGACARLRTPAPVFGYGDVSAVYQINDHVVVIVTFGDSPCDAKKVCTMLDNLPELKDKQVNLLVAALRETRQGELEQNYRKIFGEPLIFAKSRTVGQTSVDPNNLNKDDTKCVSDVCTLIAEICAMNVIV